MQRPPALFVFHLGPHREPHRWRAEDRPAHVHVLYASLAPTRSRSRQADWGQGWQRRAQIVLCVYPKVASPQVRLELRRFAQVAKRVEVAQRAESRGRLIRRAYPCRVYRVLFQTENPEWLAGPHQLEMPLERPSRPVEVFRRLCLCLFQMVYALSALREK